jgi:hypothetical protein
MLPREVLTPVQISNNVSAFNNCASVVTKFLLCIKSSSILYLIGINVESVTWTFLTVVLFVDFNLKNCIYWWLVTIASLYFATTIFREVWDYDGTNLHRNLNNYQFTRCNIQKACVLNSYVFPRTLVKISALFWPLCPHIGSKLPFHERLVYC